MSGKESVHTTEHSGGIAESSDMEGLSEDDTTSVERFSGNSDGSSDEWSSSQRGKIHGGPGAIVQDKSKSTGHRSRSPLRQRTCEDSGGSDEDWSPCLRRRIRGGIGAMFEDQCPSPRPQRQTPFQKLWETEADPDDGLPEPLSAHEDPGGSDAEWSPSSRRKIQGGSCAKVQNHGPSPHPQKRSSLPGTFPQMWKTVEDPDNGLPEPLRFCPRRTPGVQTPLDVGNPSPGEIFSNLFDGEVFRLLCANTNKNAAKILKKGKKFIWTEVNPKDMKCFIGLLLYMSVLDLPKMRDFWRKHSIFHVPFPARVMTRDRFFAILMCLHMSDPDKNEEDEQKRGTEDYDYLHWVRPLVEIVRMNTKAVYHPRQHISVDERMVGAKARLGIKQYMKAKPTKWGLKLFVLTDMNGYTIDFQIYTGKNKSPSGKGLSFDVVTSLVNRDYLGSGYIVYTDHFYTSPVLFRHLHQQGFGACGTYRPGRLGVPTTTENALDEKSPRGSVRWIREGDLLFVKWMDTREVSLCSTIHPVYSGDLVERWQKTGDGSHQRVSVPRPTAVSEYNKYMGGMDTSDQMMATNSVKRKTKKWPITVFQHLVDIAVTNSFVIHKMVSVSRGETPRTRQEFQEQIAAYLLGVDVNSGIEKGTNHHLPVSTTTGLTKEEQGPSRGRRRCKLCHRCTSWMCATCGVGLCLTRERNCHFEYHQGL